MPNWYVFIKLSWKRNYKFFREFSVKWFGIKWSINILLHNQYPILFVLAPGQTISIFSIQWFTKAKHVNTCSLWKVDVIKVECTNLFCHSLERSIFECVKSFEHPGLSIRGNIIMILYSFPPFSLYERIYLTTYFSGYTTQLCD